MMQARRYNHGKTRFELISERGLRALAAVYTAGARKYTIFRTPDGREIAGKDLKPEDGADLEIVDSGADNWRRGMPWSEVLGCAKRHIQAFSEGEDMDELGTYHLANAAWNLITILDFYESFPQGDDRKHWFKKPFKRVWADLDGCIISFESHFLEYLDLPRDHPTDWDDPRFRNNYHKITNDENFWLSVPPLVTPREITYPISGYCTSRSCDAAITQEWLSRNGFPSAPLISLAFGQSKVEALKDVCDIFIDDSIKNFVELQSNGILCYLKTRPHNEKYNVGHFRVDSLEQFFEKVRNLK